MKITVLLICSHERVRGDLQNLLRGYPDVVLYSETDSLAASNLIQNTTVDVVVLDTQMPMLNSIKTAGFMLNETGGAPLILLSAYSDERYVKESFSKGVAGYLLREYAYEELPEAIRVVAEGNCYLSPQIAENLPSGFIEENCKLEH